MQTAEIALLVSSTSAAFVGGGLIWQFILYRLSGSRLVVELRPVVRYRLGGRFTGPPKLPLDTEMTTSRINLQPSMEFAQVTITNIDRIAVSVSEIQRAFSRVRASQDHTGCAEGRCRFTNPKQRRQFGLTPAPKSSPTSISGMLSTMSGKSRRESFR